MDLFGSILRVSRLRQQPQKELLSALLSDDVANYKHLHSARATFELQGEQNTDRLLHTLKRATYFVENQLPLLILLSKLPDSTLTHILACPRRTDTFMNFLKERCENVEAYSGLCSSRSNANEALFIEGEYQYYITACKHLLQIEDKTSLTLPLSDRARAFLGGQEAAPSVTPFNPESKGRPPFSRMRYIDNELHMLLELSEGSEYSTYIDASISVLQEYLMHNQKSILEYARVRGTLEALQAKRCQDPEKAETLAAHALTEHLLHLEGWDPSIATTMSVYGDSLEATGRLEDATIVRKFLTALQSTFPYIEAEQSERGTRLSILDFKGAYKLRELAEFYESQELAKTLTFVTPGLLKLMANFIRTDITAFVTSET